MNQQLSLSNGSEWSASIAHRTDEITAGAQEEIQQFVRLWTANEKSEPERIARTVSCIRALIRHSQGLAGPDTPLRLARAPGIIARIAREPGDQSARWVSGWLQAIRDFIDVMVEPWEASKLKGEIDALLLPRPHRDWHLAARGGGGNRHSGGHRRLLSNIDLLAVLQRSMEAKSGEQAIRDRTLLELCCGSGLRPAEIIGLRWQDLRWTDVAQGRLFPVWATVRRRQQELTLPIYVRAAIWLARLRDLLSLPDGVDSQNAVFTELRRPFSPLKRRRFQEIVDGAIRDAGLHCKILDLRAAFADYLLTTHGLTEARLTSILGYALHASTLELVRENKRARAAARSRGLNLARETHG